MRTLLVVAVLLLLCGSAFAAPLRGVTIPDPEPIVPGEFQAELATLMPLWSSGGSWADLTVSAGICYNLPQAEGLEVLCPDRAVLFVAADDGTLQTKFRAGGTLDWELVPNVCAYVGGVSSVGVSVGLKANLLNASF